MNLNQIIDIAVVLVGVYATLSCICSAINEKIASWLHLRGWTLFKGVLALVDTHEMAATIFNHPLISSSSVVAKAIDPQSGKTPDPRMDTTPASNRMGRFMQVLKMKPPSYVDARNFSTALWHTVANASPQLMQEALAQATAAAAPAAAVPAAGGQPAAPNDPGGAPAAVVPAPATPKGGSSGALAMAQLAVDAPAHLITTLQRAVADVPSASLRAQLAGLLTQAGHDYDQLLAATDGWFNAQMDRVSGWYKRETAWIMAAIAFVVVTLTGVDSIEMVRVLSSDATTVAALADSVGETVQRSGVGSDGKITSTFDITQFVHPIGKPPASPATGEWNWDFRAKPADPHGYTRWPGMIVTYFALLLGGPFWFDALQSLANVRSAGRKPKRKDQPPA